MENKCRENIKSDWRFFIFLYCSSMRSLFNEVLCFFAVAVKHVMYSMPRVALYSLLLAITKFLGNFASLFTLQTNGSWLNDYIFSRVLLRTLSIC